VNLLERERETSYAAKTTNKIETTRGVYAISIPFSYHKNRKKETSPSHTVHFQINTTQRKRKRKRKPYVPYIHQN
jgi:hypothetical protein